MRRIDSRVPPSLLLPTAAPVTYLSLPHTPVIPSSWHDDNAAGVQSSTHNTDAARVQSDTHDTDAATANPLADTIDCRREHMTNKNITEPDYSALYQMAALPERIND